MDIQFRKETLLPALQAVVSVVERRQTLAVIGNVLVEAQDDGIRLTATDLEVELQSTFAERVMEPGHITIPARKFLDVVRNLNDGIDIRLQVRADKAYLTAERSRYSLSTLPAMDFPGVDQLTDTIQLQLQQKIFKRLIESTQFCMALQDVRYYLNGILLDITPGSIKAVATDGHRLAVSEISQDFDIKERFQVIIPRKGVHEIFRLLSESENLVDITISSNHIQVQLPGLRFTSKLIDGRYPDYRSVIPEENFSAILDKENFKRALVRSAVILHEKMRGVRLSLNTDCLMIHATNQDQEEAEDEIVCEYQGDKIDIAFNVTYLLDVISVIHGDSIKMVFGKKNGSCLIADTSDDRSQFVVMPMRI
jgi:DNA polymerase III subunit beta